MLSFLNEGKHCIAYCRLQTGDLFLFFFFFTVWSERNHVQAVKNTSMRFRETGRRVAGFVMSKQSVLLQ